VLDFSLQDVAERLKRSLRFRALINLKLDNTLIPFVLGMDATGDPYRTTPVTWSWPFSTTGDATHVGVTSVRNPPASGGIIVVRRFRLWTTTATNQAQWGVSRNDSGSGIPAGAALPQTCNQPWAGLINSDATPPLARFGAAANVSPAAAVLGQTFLTLNVPQVIELQSPINVYPGDAFYIIGGTNAANVAGMIEGDDYTPLP
jgi:hypothetical protein